MEEIINAKGQKSKDITLVSESAKIVIKAEMCDICSQ